MNREPKKKIILIFQGEVVFFAIMFLIYPCFYLDFSGEVLNMYFLLLFY